MFSETHVDVCLYKAAQRRHLNMEPLSVFYFPVLIEEHNPHRQPHKSDNYPIFFLMSGCGIKTICSATDLSAFSGAVTLQRRVLRRVTSLWKSESVRIRQMDVLLTF